MKELGGKQECLVGLDLPRRVGQLKQGSNPHIVATRRVRGETFEAESEAADLWQSKWNEKGYHIFVSEKNNNKNMPN